MNRMRGIALAAAMLACVMAGCGHKAASDQAVTTDIQAKLYDDTVTKPANIGVGVKNGVVTLTGDVSSSDVALEAMKIANATPGVKRVNDEMTINGASAANQLGTTPTAASGSAAPPPPGAPEQAQNTASAPPPEPVTVTVPRGERVSVRMIDSIDSAHNTAGQVFRASLDTPLISDGRVIIPAGTPCSVLLADASQAGHIKGRSELEVRLVRIDYHGRSYRVDSSIYEDIGKSRGKQTAVRTGIGAAAGAVIGALAGRGKGAAIGAAAGGGAGFGFDAFTHGPQVKIPSESVITFRLERPLTVEEG